MWSLVWQNDWKWQPRMHNNNNSAYNGAQKILSKNVAPFCLFSLMDTSGFFFLSRQQNTLHCKINNQNYYSTFSVLKGKVWHVENGFKRYRNISTSVSDIDFVRESIVFQQQLHDLLKKMCKCSTVSIQCESNVWW